ncbi:CAR1 transcription factor-like [Drosophila willistoni]|uniref:CAR1 transcription factor-like n=1 Tax=Drosophila willistoni TaxID=7260 RepID=UPI001F0823EB|nr:CAR1 transcription factor-like [Drosophila willistoni]
MSTKKTIKNAPAAAASNAAPSISPNSNKGKFGAGSGPSSNNANPNKNIKNCHIQTSERVKGTTAQFNRDKTTNPKTPRSDCREERLGVVSRPSVITTASAAVPSQDHNSNRGRSGGGNGGGSGPPPSNSSRYPTDSSQGNNFNRGPEQPTNVNSNNNRNWRQMNSTKYNSKPWQNGPSQAKRQLKLSYYQRV